MMIFHHNYFSGVLFFILIVVGFSCSPDTSPDFFRMADFNADWNYYIGDPENGASPDLDDSEWSSVYLPHDWSVVDYSVQDSLHNGPFYKNLPGGRDVGYLRDGTAWYRKEYETPVNIGAKRVILDFDGVQTEMELWVNGIKIGEHVYGYTPFKFDITSSLNRAREKNIIAVRTLNRGENSRWFAGAGIYRPVHISLLNPVSLSPWGLQITSGHTSEDSARVRFRVAVDNLHKELTVIECRVDLISPAGERIALTPVSITAEALSETGFDFSIDILKPQLWSVEQPNLYSAAVTLQCNGRESDRYETTFGIRSIEYSADSGFFMNGKEILMKGSCMHHDNGLLGAAAFSDAEFRRVKVMKENGYNAIRTSHNPPSANFLNACDELGMMVIEEAFDHWMKPKRSNDYSNYFEQWHRSDIQAMVYRDRNHPSVVMWSIGNEVPERADPEGIETGKKLIAAVREIDETRPVTEAICGFWDNPGKEWDYSAGAFKTLDIGGYNYQFLNYETDHLKYPERIMYGSETVPQHAWENWDMVKKLPYVIGDFVWTGMDYIGESGIGNARFVDDGVSESPSSQPWPWYISWCGDIDILGNKKPQSYYRDVIWGESNLEIMVATPVPEGKTARISYWGWYDELNSWNWEGNEGQPVTVRVYSSYPEVSLELNGEVVGTRKMEAADRYIAEFQVNYSPGVLQATGRDSEKRETVTLRTAKAAAKLRLLPEQKRLTAHGNSIAYIQVEVCDEEGILAINDDPEVRVVISGEAELLAAGSANPVLDGSFTDDIFNLFRGKGMIIVRSTGHTGEIDIEVVSRGVESAKVELESVD